MQKGDLVWCNIDGCSFRGIYEATGDDAVMVKIPLFGSLVRKWIDRRYVTLAVDQSRKQEFSTYPDAKNAKAWGLKIAHEW